MAISRKDQNRFVDLIPEKDLEKADQPQYHVDYLKKRYPLTSLLFTRKEQAKIVVKHMVAAETLSAIQKHNASCDPEFNSLKNPDMYCDEASYKKLCASKKK